MSRLYSDGDPHLLFTENETTRSASGRMAGRATSRTVFMNASSGGGCRA